MPPDTSSVAEPKPSGFFASLRKSKRQDPPKLSVPGGDSYTRDLTRRVDALTTTDAKLGFLLTEMQACKLDGKGRVLRVLYPIFESHHIRPEAVTRIWAETYPCLLSNHLDVRILALDFMAKCAEYQRLDVPTAPPIMYYDFLWRHLVTIEELPHMLEALLVLTQDGKYVDDLQETILRLMGRWINFCAFHCKGMVASFTNSPVGPSYRTLFKLLQVIFESHFDRLDEDEVVRILEFLCTKVATTTADPEVIREILTVIETIPRFGGIIPMHAVPHVLGFICLYSASKPTIQYSDQFWRITCAFLSLKNVAHLTLRMLEDIPLHPLTQTSQALEPRDHRRHRSRGALVLLGKVLEEESKPHNPLKATLTVTRALQCLEKAVQHQDLSVDDIVLKELLRILRSDVVATISFEDWEIIWNLLNQVIRAFMGAKRQTLQLGMSADGEASREDRTKNHWIRNMQDQFIEIATELRHFCTTTVYTGAMTQCVNFHMVLSRAMEVDASSHELILGHYRDAGLCLPGNSNWLVECEVMFHDYIRNEKRDVEHRQEAMHILRDSIILVDPVQEDFNRRVLYPLFHLVRTDKTCICQDLIHLAVEIATPDKEQWIIDITKNLFARSLDEPFSTLHGRHASTISGTTAVGSATEPTRDLNVESAAGLVAIFEKSLQNNSPLLAQKLFSDLVHLSQKSVKDVRVRLEALDALLRLRADSLYCVYLEEWQSPTFTKPLASGIPWVKATLMLLVAEKEGPPTLPPGPSVVNDSRASSIAGQVRIVSEIIPQNSLKTFDDHVSDDETDDEETSQGESRSRMAKQQQKFILPVPLYLETVIDIIRDESNWYVYNLLLKRFPDQLVNKTLFMSCDSAIIRLREVLCQQQLNSQFPKFDYNHTERIDVVIRLHTILTALIGYHDLFVKASKDELVRCFQFNMGRYTSQVTMMCIHALTVCGHELPKSIARCLAGILQTLSHLITNSALSIHILEFLVGVGRMPKIHDSFTPDDFMTVFQVALKYLQFKYGERESFSGDEGRLSQYIIYLAYEALTVWYLAVRLENRRAHVRWIVRQLILANFPHDLDHQAQAFVDMLERFSFSDSPLRKYPESTEVEGLVPFKKHWVVGESIRTAQIVREDGLVKVFVRKPVC